MDDGTKILSRETVAESPCDKIVRRFIRFYVILEDVRFIKSTERLPQNCGKQTAQSWFEGGGKERGYG
jgi:hypothetical protein